MRLIASNDYISLVRYNIVFTWKLARVEVSVCVLIHLSRDSVDQCYTLDYKI